MRTVQRHSLQGFLLSALLLAALPGAAESIRVLNQQDEPFAQMLGNPYCWITVVTRHEAPGVFNCSEKMFPLMPQRTVLNEPTLDENESRIRLFLDPRVRTMDHQNSTLAAVSDWNAQDLPDGVVLTPANAPAMPVGVRIRVQPMTEQSILQVSAEINNPGTQAHIVECELPFYGQMPGLNPPRLVIPHGVTRFHAVNGKVEKKQITLRDEVELNGEEENYWWRKLIADETRRRLNNTIREEKIPFQAPKLPAPDYLTVSGMVGDSILIFQNVQELTRLELMWQAAVLRVTPVFQCTVPPQSSKTFSFRLLLGKGITRVDNITEHFVSAYTVQDSSVKLSLMPLDVIRQVTLDVALHGSAGNVIATRSFEVKGMSPFEPWQEELEINAKLLSGSQYPIKLHLNDTISARRLYELENVIVP